MFRVGHLRRIAGASICYLLSVLASVLISLPAAAGSIDLLVPAYGNPCCGGGVNQWQVLIDTARNGPSNVQLNVIFNPASGPGSAVDPNYVDNSGSGPLPDIKAAGAKIYGYVPTGFASRNIQDVKNDVDAYFTTLYPSLVDGIFFDEMSNDLANVAYYNEIRDHVKQNSEATVIGNPGTSFTNNPSGQTQYGVNDYARSADVIVTFESPSGDYANNYTPPSWVDDFGPENFAHLVFAQALWDETLVSQAASRNASLLYVTHDILPNPWGELATYWQQELQSLSSYNTNHSVVPIPAALPLFGTGLGIMGFIGWRRKRKMAQAAS